MFFHETLIQLHVCHGVWVSVYNLFLTVDQGQNSVEATAVGVTLKGKWWGHRTVLPPIGRGPPE